MDYIDGHFEFKGRRLSDDLARHFTFEKCQPTWSPPCQTVADALLKEAEVCIREGFSAKNLGPLSLGLMTLYGWQVANGAPLLPNQNELAKIHHSRGALYFWSRERCA